MRPALLRHVQMRGLHWIAEEVVAAVGEHLAKDIQKALLAEPDQGFPARAWNSSAAPSAEDAAAFQTVVWRQLKLRGADELRRFYVRKRHQAALEEAAETSTEPSHALIAREHLVLLAQAINELPDVDRELLLESVDGIATKSNAERQRLFRLRRRLAEIVQQRAARQGG